MRTKLQTAYRALAAIVDLHNQTDETEFDVVTEGIIRAMSAMQVVVDDLATIEMFGSPKPRGVAPAESLPDGY